MVWVEQCWQHDQGETVAVGVVPAAVAVVASEQTVVVTHLVVT